MNVTLGIKILAILAFVAVSTASIVQLPAGALHLPGAVDTVGAVVAVSGN